MEERHLGDNIYAHIDDNFGFLVLTTKQGRDVTNTILLQDPDGVDALLRFITDMRAEA